MGFRCTRSEWRVARVVEDQRPSAVAFPEKEIARSELQRTGFLTKKLRRIHECNAIVDGDYKRGTIAAKLRLCDNRYAWHRHKFFVSFVSFVVNFTGLS